MPPTSTRRTVPRHRVDHDAVLADIAAITKALRLVLDGRLMSPQDRVRLRRLADVVTVGQLVRLIAPLHPKPVGRRSRCHDQ